MQNIKGKLFIETQYRYMAILQTIIMNMKTLINNNNIVRDDDHMFKHNLFACQVVLKCHNYSDLRTTTRTSANLNIILFDFRSICTESVEQI